MAKFTPSEEGLRGPFVRKWQFPESRVGMASGCQWSWYVLDSESPAASTRVRVERPPLSRTLRAFVRKTVLMIGQPPFDG